MVLSALHLATLFIPAVQMSSTQQQEPCGRYTDVDSSFPSVAKFTLLPKHGVVFTQGAVFEMPSMTMTGCGRECVSTEGCVMFTFQLREKGASGRCRVYDQVSLHAENWELLPGAWSYVLDTEAFGRFHNGYFWKSGRCIRVLKERLSYQNATQRCSQMDGGHLLFTKTTEDLQIGNQIAEEYGFPRIWVGADDLKREGLFRWTDGSSLPNTSSLWAPGEPNSRDGQQECVTLWSTYGKLDDFFCVADPERAVNTVCQRDV